MHWQTKQKFVTSKKKVIPFSLSLERSNLFSVSFHKSSSFGKELILELETILLVQGDPKETQPKNC